MDAAGKDLALLPKAHLHLHLTGGMRPQTLIDLAQQQGRHLPAELLNPLGARMDVTIRRGWPRFQRLYETARSLLRGPVEVRRVVREIVEDQAFAGVGWLELQVDPTTYAVHLGGLHATVDLVLDELATAGTAHGVGTGLVIAANRTRHPSYAETLARLARQYAGQGVVGFGLSNDETVGDTAAFAKAFRLAADAGLVAVPHAGELRGPRSVREAVEHLGAVRLGHGVRAAEDPELLDLLAERGVVCEICPASNDALGVLPRDRTPVVRMREAGVLVALGADDPLLFRSGLLEQYAGLGATAEVLADLAVCSIRGSTAPAAVKSRLVEGVQGWSAGP